MPEPKSGSKFHEKLQKGLPVSALQLVVTGISGGVGQALLAHFGSAGATVVGLDKATPTHEEKNTAYPGFCFIRTDISRTSAIRTIKRRVGAITKRIDVLVHAAGIFLDDAEVLRSEGRLSELWRTNYVGPYAVTEILLPLLRRGVDPLVIFISSTDAIVASGGQDCEIGVVHDTHYAATKGALITATRCLAMKWAKYGIRVNAICPTVIRTPMAAKLLAQRRKEKQLASHIPLGRICEPDDVAVAVECLYRLHMTTAHVLPLDGGYLCI
jgi:NAD(P)-dependent dehydrogenase (short-subunit alcohol dehydrogenase family)